MWGADEVEFAAYNAITCQSFVVIPVTEYLSSTNMTTTEPCNNVRQAGRDHSIQLQTN